MVKTQIDFIKESIKTFRNTGTVLPSSRFAAAAMTKFMEGERQAMKIIEIGAGTGPVTSAILDRLQEGDKLDICELNPEFVKQLRPKVEKHAAYTKFLDKIHVFEGPIQDFPETEKYDLIICSLPFLNFDVALVDDIFNKLKRLSHAETIMVYYEYMGIRQLRKNIPTSDNDRIRSLDDYFSQHCVPRRVDKIRVWLNLLPINVYVLKPAA